MSKKRKLGPFAPPYHRTAKRSPRCAFCDFPPAAPPGAVPVPTQHAAPRCARSAQEPHDVVSSNDPVWPQMATASALVTAILCGILLCGAGPSRPRMLLAQCRSREISHLDFASQNRRPNPSNLSSRSHVLGGVEGRSPRRKFDLQGRLRATLRTPQTAPRTRASMHTRRVRTRALSHTVCPCIHIVYP